MSETNVVSGTIEPLYSEGRGRFEQAKWLVENTSITFEEYNESDKEVNDPNYFYIFGDWYVLVESTNLDSRCSLVYNTEEDGTITFTAMWYDGSYNLEGLLDDIISEDY